MDLQEIVKYGSVSILPPLSTTTWCETNVCVVGCGGTGSRLIPLLAQAIKNHNTDIETNPRNTNFLKHKMNLVLCDCDDGVEVKNLLRQNFLKTDVGKRKEVVFAERISSCYGLDCIYISDKFSIDNFRQVNRDNNIIFDCTDNFKARKSIEEATFGMRNCVIISGGNEDTFGQALISCKPSYSSNNSNVLNTAKSLIEMINFPDKKNKKTFHYLPTLLEFYPDFKDTATASCTDIVLQNEQSMPINNLVATLMYNMFYNLISGNEFNYHIVKCSINNIFDTKKISHPKVYLDVVMKGITGGNVYSLDIIKDFELIGDKFTLFEALKSFIEKHKKSSIKLAKEKISTAYFLTGVQLQELQNLIEKIENE